MAIIPLHGMVDSNAGNVLSYVLCRRIVVELDCGCLRHIVAEVPGQGGCVIGINLSVDPGA